MWKIEFRIHDIWIRIRILLFRQWLSNANKRKFLVFFYSFVAHIRNLHFCKNIPFIHSSCASTKSGTDPAAPTQISKSDETLRLISFGGDDEIRYKGPTFVTFKKKGDLGLGIDLWADQKFTYTF